MLERLSTMKRPRKSDGDAAIDVARLVFSSLPVAILLPFVAGLALGVRVLVASPRFSASATFVVLATAFIGTFTALMRRRSPRAGVLAACHLLTWTPFVVLGVMELVRDGIVPEPYADKPGVTEQLMRAPLGGLVFLVVGTCVGIALSSKRFDRTLRLVAFPVVALAGGAGSCGVMSLSSHRDPDSYVASLRQVAELYDGHTAVVGGRTIEYGRRTISEPSPPWAIAELTGTRSHEECRVAGISVNVTTFPGYGKCPPLRVLLDDAGDVALIDGVYPQAPRTYVAFRPSDGKATGVSAVTLRDRFAPPIGWTLGSLFGAVVGLGCLHGALRLRRRARNIAGIEAKHRGEGLVELPNGEVARVPAASILPRGYVVLGERSDAVATYRDAGGPRFGAAWAGKLETLRTARLDLAASLEAIALSCALLGVAPLLVVRLLTW